MTSHIVERLVGCGLAVFVLIVAWAIDFGELAPAMSMVSTINAMYPRVYFSLAEQVADQIRWWMIPFAVNLIFLAMLMIAINLIWTGGENL